MARVPGLIRFSKKRNRGTPRRRLWKADPIKWEDASTTTCTNLPNPTRVTLQTTKEWSAVKPYFSKKGKQSDTIQLQVDGQILSDPQEVAETFNTYFTNVAKNIGKDCPYLDNYDEHPSLDTIDKHVNDIGLGTFSFTTMTEKNITDIIDRLPTGKSPGYDSITSKCIKAVDSIICKPILTITKGSHRSTLKAGS